MHSGGSLSLRLKGLKFLHLICGMKAEAVCLHQAEITFKKNKITHTTTKNKFMLILFYFFVNASFTSNNSPGFLKRV